MNMTDPIADMITRIRNGVRARLPKIDVPASRLKSEIARILKDEGYIANFRFVDDGRQGTIRIFLKYGPGWERVITDLQRVSQPGCRIYCGKDEIPRVYGGLGINILSTSRGVMTGREAAQDRRGRRDPLQRLVRSTTMSRVGRKIIAVPTGVKVSVSEAALEVQGPKGKLTTPVPPGIKFALDGHGAELPARERRAPAAGLPRPGARARAERGQGRDRGLHQGPRHRRRRLPRRRSRASKVVFALGYSHPVEYPIPEGIKIAVEKQTRVTVSGIDRQKVGQVAAEIRQLRKPDPYKQKGIRYVGEVLKKKAGKAGATGAK